MKVVLISGTWASRPAWIFDDWHPFRVMLTRHDFDLARVRGEAYTWPSKLSGLPFINPGHWNEHGRRLAEFCEHLNFEDRNLIAYSHGAQVAICAAAIQWIRYRTLTTIGAPVRRDVPVRRAAANVGLWQHLYDQKRDWMATLRRNLGSIGDGALSLDRVYHETGIWNIPLGNIRHGDLLSEDVHLWEEKGLIENIRRGRL